MTSLLRELVSLPGSGARSTRRTDRPSSARARAMARPMTPAPTMITSKSGFMLDSVIVPIPVDEAADAVAIVGAGRVAGEPLQQRRVGPCCRDVAHLHRHHIALCFPPYGRLDGRDEIEQADLVRIAD